MNNKRVLQFAFAGLLVALALEAVGYRMDLAVPHLKLEDQVLYNWLTLCFSPATFFLRLGAPDGPIAASRTTFFAALFSNFVLYAAFYKGGQILIVRLKQKLAHENALLVARSRSRQARRLARSEFETREI
jgi:hypothetical protein